LVRVAHGEQSAGVAGPEAKGHDQPMKSEAEVLVFVHDEDREPGGQHLPHPRLRFDETQAEKYHVVEVDKTCAAEPPLVLLDDLG